MGQMHEQPMKLLLNFLLCTLLLPGFVYAESFPLPQNGDTVIGQARQIASVYEDTFTQLGRRYNFGYSELRQANPDVDPWLPGTGTTINLPSFYVLPDAPQEGIVINLAEFRLYYYPPANADGSREVQTYPLGIGRDAFPTPELSAEIKARIPNPAWYPPESIIAEHAAKGQVLPRTVPPGPDNPLGDYAIQLTVPGYFIHGTNRAAGIGLQVSHGCIRMYPEDIEELFYQVSIGVPVRVVHQPVKVGILDGQIYAEVHPSTQEDEDSIQWLVTSQLQKLVGERSLRVNWDLIDESATQQSGIPTEIAAFTATLNTAIR